MRHKETLPEMLCIVLALCLAIIAGCSRDSAKKRLHDHVAYLASEEVQSKPPLEEDALAREYIARYFEQCGLEPPYEGRFSQDFPVLWGMNASKNNSVTVVINNRSRQLRHGGEFGIERHSGSGRGSGKAVFVGYGIHAPEKGYDDFARVDVKDKIVICISFPPKNVDKAIRKMASEHMYHKKAQLVDSLGGLAVIYTMPSSVKQRDVLPRINEKYRDRHPVRSVRVQKIPMIRVSHSALISIMKDSGRDLDAIEKRLESAARSIAFDMPDVEISVDAVMNHHYCSGYNMLGRLPGSDPSKTIIICADYDHLGFAGQFGTEDAERTASGVSLVLELARLCSERGGYGCNLLFVAYGADTDYYKDFSFFEKHRDKVAPNVAASIFFGRVGEYSKTPLYIHRTEAARRLLKHAGDDMDLAFSNIGSGDPEKYYKTRWPEMYFYTGEFVTDDTAMVCIRRPPLPIDEIDFDGMAEILHFAMQTIDDIDSGRLDLAAE